jgi:pyruvate kinase
MIWPVWPFAAGGMDAPLCRGSDASEGQPPRAGQNSRGCAQDMLLPGMETAVSSNSPKDTFRQTKIVFTLGPASSDEGMLEQLIHEGIVWSTADSIMLSGETTTGRYPLECVQFMKRVAGRVEASASKGCNSELPLRSPKDHLLRSAVVLAQELGDFGIVVFTRNGSLPQTLSAMRARRCPIYAFTDAPQVFRHLLLVWGVEPFLMTFSEEPELTIRNSFDYLIRRGWVKRGDLMVVVTNVLAGMKIVDTIQMRPVE